MCFSKSRKLYVFLPKSIVRKLEIKTALHDIDCYKIMEKDRLGRSNYAVSLHTEHLYKIGELNGYNYKGGFANNVDSKHGWIEVHYAYHSYLFSSENVSQYIKEKAMGWASNYFLYKCMIPKGSKYIINDAGEIVSDQIIIISLYEPKATANNGVSQSITV